MHKPSPTFWLLLLAAVSSCSTPPKPPTVDESIRRPANSAEAVELQVCKNDLTNARILATESNRLATSTAATLERFAAHPTSTARLAAPMPPPANAVYIVQFDFASTRAIVPADSASALIAEARTAPLIVLRGRTDGNVDTLAESRVARARTATVRDYLISAGVDPSRIRATYQPIGDPIADNTDPMGRALNRRVEIEVYRTLPISMNALSTNRP